jgi:[ribosomal protein S18]-alanine N-acetyltransferase
MPLSTEVQLRVAAEADLPAIADLRHVAGWAVHDWALRAVLVPPHARCFVATDGDGRIIGVGSAIAYDRLGVVGNMVVAVDHRRRGIGGAILEAVLAFLAERSVTRFELSATDLGRPLYARYGFEPNVGGVSAVVPRALHGDREAGIGLAEAGPDSLGALADYDTPRFGGDRRPLLTTMLADPDRPVLLARRDDAIVGWGWARPEADRIGPLVADSPAAATSIVIGALERMPATATVRLNMPGANRVGAEAFAALGATIEPWNGRMARGPDVPRRDDTIFATAVGALG